MSATAKKAKPRKRRSRENAEYNNLLIVLSDRTGTMQTTEGIAARNVVTRFDPCALRLDDPAEGDPHDADTFATWLAALPGWAQWVVACEAATLAVRAAGLVDDDYRVAMAAIDARRAWLRGEASKGELLTHDSLCQRQAGIRAGSYHALWACAWACDAEDGDGEEPAHFAAENADWLGVTYPAIARRARAILAFRVAGTEVER